MVKGKKKKSGAPGGSEIAVNRRARHDYFIEDTRVAGLVLEGWEVKSLRANRANLSEAYVVLRNGEVWLIGAHFSPLASASTHVNPDPTRTRKLLLNRAEIRHLIGAVERKGYTLVPLKLFWSRGSRKARYGAREGQEAARQTCHRAREGLGTREAAPAQSTLRWSAWEKVPACAETASSPIAFGIHPAPRRWPSCRGRVENCGREHDMTYIAPNSGAVDCGTTSGATWL